MAADKTEVRGLWPADLAQALDAIAYTNGMDRNAYLIKVATAHVQKVAHKAKILQSMSVGNPLLSEPVAPTTDWGDLT
jgi:hypothetical protein